jgi:hypothetical protein
VDLTDFLPGKYLPDNCRTLHLRSLTDKLSCQLRCGHQHTTGKESFYVDLTQVYRHPMSIFTKQTIFST